MSNKFNFAWQLVRVQARKIKEVGEKIEHVMDYLRRYPNVHNYDRILNWLKMAKLGYKGSTYAANAFNKAIKQLEDNKEMFNSPEDNESNLVDAHTEDIQAVLDDLSKRKYDFQYNETPKAHTEFVAQLEKELARR